MYRPGGQDVPGDDQAKRERRLRFGCAARHGGHDGEPQRPRVRQVQRRGVLSAVHGALQTQAGRSVQEPLFLQRKISRRRDQKQTVHADRAGSPAATAAAPAGTVAFATRATAVAVRATAAAAAIRATAAAATAGVRAMAAVAVRAMAPAVAVWPAVRRRSAAVLPPRNRRLVSFTLNFFYGLAEYYTLFFYLYFSRIYYYYYYIFSSCGRLLHYHFCR